MSLDVYLRIKKPVKQPAGSGIFVREGGQKREISWEEWNQKFPGSEPVMVPQPDEDDFYSNVVFQANITHNLNQMADVAGLYEALWHPAELDPTRKARIKEQTEKGNYHGPDGAYAIEDEVTIHARDLIKPIMEGLERLREEPEKFKAFNPPNGWGSYEIFVPWVERYLAACIENPDAVVEVSR